MNQTGSLIDQESRHPFLENLSFEEKSALEGELRLAASIQQARLPDRRLSRPGWQSDFQYLPAGPVGGDYCDLFESHGALYFLVGDVSGKGVGASLLASHLHAMFRGLAETGPPLQRMVETANRIFCQSTPSGQFATLVVGRADLYGCIEFVSAGHLPLLHIRSNAIRLEGATGVPLGLFADASFPSRHLFLAKGESLLICTDGVTEARNRADEEYGIQRLKIVAARRSAASPTDLLDQCFQDMSAFTDGNKRTDDITLMSISRRS